jgi:hypothetical protein
VVCTFNSKKAIETQQLSSVEGRCLLFDYIEKGLRGAHKGECLRNTLGAVNSKIFLDGSSIICSPVCLVRVHLSFGTLCITDAPHNDNEDER